MTIRKANAAAQKPEWWRLLCAAGTVEVSTSDSGLPSLADMRSPDLHAAIDQLLRRRDTHRIGRDTMVVRHRCSPVLMPLTD
jgi:hypothetical protein